MTESEKKEQKPDLEKQEQKPDLEKQEQKPDLEKQEQKPDLEKEKTVEEKLKIVEEKLLRTLADMENQRRRFEKERQEAFEFGGFNFAKESLSLLDNIERAIDSFKNDEKLKNNKDLNKIIDGIDIVKKDLISIFKKNGIEPIECKDKKFDPNFHQAILEVSNNTKEDGIVVQEIQKGYMMKNRLLRPSLVGVTKKREEKDPETPPDNKKTEKKG